MFALSPVVALYSISNECCNLCLCCHQTDLPAAGRHQGQGDRGCCSPHWAVCGGRGWEFITCFINYINTYDTLSVLVSVSHWAVCWGRGWEFITCFINYINTYDTLSVLVSVSHWAVCGGRGWEFITCFTWIIYTLSVPVSVPACLLLKGIRLQGQTTAGWVVPTLSTEMNQTTGAEYCWGNSFSSAPVSISDCLSPWNWKEPNYRRRVLMGE